MTDRGRGRNRVEALVARRWANLATVIRRLSVAAVTIVEIRTGPTATVTPADAPQCGATLAFMIESLRLPGLTLADADWLVEAALAVGAERGFPPLAVAVIDVGGEPIALRRTDGGMPMTSRIAVAKARSALIALKPSGLIDLPSGITGGIQHLYHGDFVPWAGGVLVTDGNVILGAAGASGAHALEDEQAVQVAVERWQAHRSHE